MYSSTVGVVRIKLVGEYGVLSTSLLIVAIISRTGSLSVSYLPLNTELQNQKAFCKFGSTLDLTAKSDLNNKDIYYLSFRTTSYFLLWVYYIET